MRRVLLCCFLVVVSFGCSPESTQQPNSAAPVQKVSDADHQNPDVAGAQEAHSPPLAPTAMSPDEAAADEIRTLLSDDKVKEAEAAFQAAYLKYPKSEVLLNLRARLYAFNERDGFYDAALAHLQIYLTDYVTLQPEDPERAAVPTGIMLDHLIPTFEKAGRAEEGYKIVVPQLVDYMKRVVAKAHDDSDWADALPGLAFEYVMPIYQEAGRAEEGLAWLEQTMATVKAAPSDTTEHLLNNLFAVKVKTLIKMDRVAEGQSLTRTYVTDAREKFAAAPDDAVAAADLANAMQFWVDVLNATPGDELKAARKEWMSFSEKQLALHSDNVDLLIEYFFAHATEIARLINVDGLAADALYEQVNATLAKLDSKDASFAMTVNAIKEKMPELRAGIDQTLPAFQVIGQPARPVVSDAWVNGEAISPDELKGKVVMLDFFAMWCQPCIQTFPELVKWQTEYGDDGLVIIGVTNYVEHDWNEETKIAYEPKDRTVTPEQERVALGKFATYYQLKHRLAIMPDQEFPKAYGVHNIPHVVLIDREGVVRLVRIGMPEESAMEVEATIRELLGIKATTAAAR